MTKQVLLLSACFLLAGPPGGASESEPTVRLFVTPISNSLEIVTQVSSTSPFVGQQHSIIYSLRTLQAPSAVDLDPQQYSGFWTEPAQLSEQRQSIGRLQNGRQASEYLLRQVIAFPLWPGSLALPPLRVKIKNPDSRTSGEEWDTIGTSNPVPILAKSLTPVPDHGQVLPLVGVLEGSLTPEGSGERSYLLLELKGTANLALFQPKEWLKASPDVRWSIRLKDWDDTVQTRDTGGHRQLSLLQWRRWEIRPAGSAGTVHLEDLVIPVFQPVENRWITVRIRGCDIKARAASWPAESPQVGGEPSADNPLLRNLTLKVTGSALLVFFAFVLLVLWLRRTSEHR